MGGGNPADLVLMGGHAYLVDAARSWAGAVAVSDGRIAAEPVMDVSGVADGWVQVRERRIRALG